MLSLHMYIHIYIYIYIYIYVYIHILYKYNIRKNYKRLIQELPKLHCDVLMGSQFLMDCENFRTITHARAKTFMTSLIVHV